MSSPREWRGWAVVDKDAGNLLDEYGDLCTCSGTRRTVIDGPPLLHRTKGGAGAGLMQGERVVRVVVKVEEDE